MLKLGEELIYETSTGVELVQGGSTFVDVSTLSITNLGRVIINTDNTHNDQVDETYIYNYSTIKKKIMVSIQDGKIVASCEKLLFSPKIMANLKMQIGIDELNEIGKNQDEFIFRIKDHNAIVELDDLKESYMGDVDFNDYEIYIQDYKIPLIGVEEYKIDGMILNLYGSFYLEKKDLLIKEIKIFSKYTNEISEYLEGILKTDTKGCEVFTESEMVKCHMSGHIDNIDYIQEEILIVSQENKLLFISTNSNKLINKVNISNIRKLILNQEVILYDGTNIFNLYVTDDKIAQLGLENIENIDSEIVGYTINHIPFLIEYTREGLFLLKSEKKEILKIDNQEIEDIVIGNEEKYNNERFTEIEIIFLNREIKINISTSIVSKLIRKVFIYSKEEELNNASNNEIYINWAKSINDIILLDFFGGLYYIKSESDRLINENKSETIHNLTVEQKIAVVNMIYYEIQTQKKQFDSVAAYLPKFMEVSSIKIFDIFSKKVDTRVFKNLQKQLFSISRQLNRHLNDIEKSINRIDFIIQDEFKSNELSKDLFVKELGVGLGLSIGVEDNLEKMKISITQMIEIVNKNITIENLKEEEIKKINIFTYQTIDKLNHLVTKMYPYYVDEANTSLFNIFNVLGKEYSKLGEEKILKNTLFNRMTDLYLYKQIKVNRNSDIRIKDIIKSISLGLDENMYKMDDENLLIRGE